MWNPIKPHLFEHIDGLDSKIENPKKFIKQYFTL